ncbi:MAG: DUF4364 family protein [Ruminococcaceae bacterium]|nr:DUF4364 family protein [Oscillospiraceae bacterium]
MDFVYRPSEYELKLSVLFVVKNLKTSASAPIISEIISSVVETDFFELGHLTHTLVESENLEVFEIDSNKVFSITDTGEDTLKFFYNDIPFSVREKFIKKIDEVNRQVYLDSLVTAKVYPVNEKGETMVQCEINDLGERIFNLELTVGSFNVASSIAEKFKQNSEEIYQEIIKLLS